MTVYSVLVSIDVLASPSAIFADKAPDTEAVQVLRDLKASVLDTYVLIRGIAYDYNATCAWLEKHCAISKEKVFITSSLYFTSPDFIVSKNTELLRRTSPGCYRILVDTDTAEPPSVRDDILGIVHTKNVVETINEIIDEEEVMWRGR